MIKRRLSEGTLAGLFAALGAGSAALCRRWRAPASPSPKQIGFQEAVTPVARTSTGCTTTSTSSSSPSRPSCWLLMLYVMWRFSEKRNPTPSRTTHNTTLEVLWTVIPVLILVAIAIPSFKLLYFQYTFPPPDLTIKATGHAWNWTHEYPDQGISVDSVMLQDDEREEAIKAGHAGRAGAAQPRRRQRDPGAGQQGGARARHLQRRDPQLDHPVVRVQGRCRARPHHGDVVQGTKEGIYFGQCSELCGKDHAFMPIAVRVVKEQVFNDWAAALKAQRQEEGQGDHPQRRGRARRSDQDRRRPRPMR